MSGVKGRSGRRPLPVSTHILRGTFRKDRHGARLSAGVEGATALQPDLLPTLPKALTDGLKERGLELAIDLWTRYGDWEPEKLVLLHECGVVADALGEYQSIIRQDGRVKLTPRGHEVPHPLLRVQAQAHRTLAILLSKLDLKEE